MDFSVFSLFSVPPFKFLKAKSRETPKIRRSYGVSHFAIPFTEHRKSFAKHRKSNALMGVRISSVRISSFLTVLLHSAFHCPATRVSLSQVGINFHHGHGGRCGNSQFHAVLVHNQRFHFKLALGGHFCPAKAGVTSHWGVMKVCPAPQ